jgi:dipeptidyl aminopeptidase/acylaminoacyl peptidase
MARTEGMMMTSTADAAIAPFGSWKSPITSDLIVAQAISLSEVRLAEGAIYWLEGRPQEQGRFAVVRATADGAATDLTPRPFNVRTRVHEYGGGAWTVADGDIYFSNFADGRLYRQLSGAAPEPMTPAAPDGRQWRFADGIVDRRRNRWIGVREEHTAGSHLPENTIVAVDLRHPDQPPRILAGGHDFVSSPRLSPDGSNLLWLAWDFPNMPWNGTTLWVADIRDDGTPGPPRTIAGGPTESVFQPEWSPDGARLTFVSDRSGWWNLCACDGAAGNVTPLAPRQAEFGVPQWVFGLSTYAFAGNDRIVCTYQEAGLGHLAVLDLTGRTLREIETPFTEFGSLRADGDTIVFRAGAPDRPGAIVTLDLKTGAHRILKTTTGLIDDPALRLPAYLSKADSIAFPTSGGDTAHALFYPPHNPDYAAPAGDKPPLLVKCHGGPTSAASSSLSLGTQYWTSRGIAVLDVNYRGSTGFGRAYRDKLAGTWGIVDVDDAIAGARFLIARGVVDDKRIVISGGSAGGYTTLAALVLHDFFAGGASYYGVSDIAALARDTHKFESRYLDWLIGPWPAAEALYRDRSPLTHADRLGKPVIFFQGDEDAIVPPNQTEMMVEALRRRGIPVGYFLFTGEQHGFRKSENIKRALDAELAFYAIEVFRTGLRF